MTEIERKFVADAPPAGLMPGDRIRQAYVAVDGPTEVRIRERDGTCTLTVKSGHGLERDEVEIPIDNPTFGELWSLAPTRRIEKRRTEVTVDAATDGSVVAEVDVFVGDLDGLVLVEVEFADRAAAEAFEPPAWFGTEVTGTEAWNNASLATHGRPR